MPAAAVQLGRSLLNHVPYTSQKDMILFKLEGAGMRGDARQRDIDARDARDLLNAMTRPCTLDEGEWRLVEPHLPQVTGWLGTMIPLSWWTQRFQVVV